MLDEECNSALSISEIDKQAMCEFQFACSFLYYYKFIDLLIRPWLKHEPNLKWKKYKNYK